MASEPVLRDLTEEQLRAAAPMKWVPDGPGVIQTWVAEMDFALAEPVHTAVQRYAEHGVFGYPAPAVSTGVLEAFTGFAQRRWDWSVDTGRIVATGDVMEGMRLVLEQLAPEGPVIVPTPVYPPFLDLVRGLGRELLTVPIDPDAERAELDLAGIRAAVAVGGRALLLCHPHNPVGRSWTAAELAALREIVEPAGVHVVSDEIHAPLVHPGVGFVPYATVASPDAPVSTLASATKAFSMPGLRCALVVSHRAQDHARLTGLPHVLNHGVTMLGQVAARAAYEHAEPWLDAVRDRIAANQALFTGLLAAHLPGVRVRPAEATYLSWLDLRALDLTDPVGSALRGGVRIDGQDFGPGGQGHVRVNLATSTERVEQIAARLAAAWR